MCIMEVRPGQQSTTMAQAMAHNTSTIERDLDMFRPLLVKRGDTDGVARIDRAQAYLYSAYQEFLALFTEECDKCVDRAPDAPVGNERVKRVDAEMIAAAHRAEHFETR